MHRITPRIKNISAYIYSCICLICGLALFVLPMQSDHAYSVIPQIFGAILLVASLYIFGAHIAREFTFEIAPRDVRSSLEICDFVIYENRGKRSIVVCRIGLEDIRSVSVITSENRRIISKKSKSMRRFTYDRAFIPKKQIVVFTENDAIKITYDETLFRILGGNKQ